MSLRQLTQAHPADCFCDSIILRYAFHKTVCIKRKRLSASGVPEVASQARKEREAFAPFALKKTPQCGEIGTKIS
jgi:hypothetical protein